MSNRFYDFDVKGSSRSGRDDSRRAQERDRDRHGEGRRLEKSRSRSPRTQSPGPRNSRYKTDKNAMGYQRVKTYDREDSDPDELPTPPPPPRISKISMDFTKPKVAPIKMSLSSTSRAPVIPKPTVASVFDDDDDDDEQPEEMPAEARMRMRNIGRETPTSAGPNSFGKTKQGFCDAKKVFEKNLKQSLETEDKPRLPKFPQTIYKIKGP